VEVHDLVSEPDGGEALAGQPAETSASGRPCDANGATGDGAPGRVAAGEPIRQVPRRLRPPHPGSAGPRPL